MNTDVSQCHARIRRATAYLLLFIQLFLPLSAGFSGMAQAAQENDIPDVMAGLQALMNDTSPPATPVTLPQVPTVSPVPAKPQTVLQAPSPDSIMQWHETQRAMNTPLQHTTGVALPALGSPEGSHAAPDNSLAQGLSRTGELLSSDDITRASVGYARSIGENLVNQQINDWLSLYGKARVQLGSDGRVDADFLLPLRDAPDSLLFAQAGMRNTDERNITNLGVGYRQYEDGWMWGVNSFYDYDLTGDNARLGTGVELWRDYLKLAANGYYRLTDWHQSALHAMRDYDERPANGFDVRLEGYLPAWPQLGFFTRYEQYFGQGVSLADSASVDSLKNNPSRATAGVSYTPFPLMTLKGQKSVGDSSETRVDVAFTYRLGVPLRMQLDGAAVDLMRSLAGNRYDFVDRNYNIVMQYRKQQLISISLPESLQAEAAETVPVSLTVNKAKYGVKRVSWQAPELEARGGKLVVSSLTGISLTLPPYLAENGTDGPQRYRLTAEATDNEGNLSNQAVMWINVTPSLQTISRIALSQDTPVVADEQQNYSVTALLRDEKNTPLADKVVTFTVLAAQSSRSTTGSEPAVSDLSRVTLRTAGGESGQSVSVTSDAAGQAVITAVSSQAGRVRLKAAMLNGNSAVTELTFKADATTARVASLVLTEDGAVADGKSLNQAVATVTDAQGNALSGMTPVAVADNNAQVATPLTATDSRGQTTVSFSSVKSGASTLTVALNGSQQQVTGQFIADITTAKIATLVQDSTGEKLADGSDAHQVTVSVVDGNENPLANAPVTIALPAGVSVAAVSRSAVLRSSTQMLTDAQGQLAVTLTSTVAGTHTVTFSINGDQREAQVAFRADASTARVTSLTLQRENNELITVKEASGDNHFLYTATVADAQGNPVPGVTVEAQADSDRVTASGGVSGENGEAVVTLSHQFRTAAGVMVSARTTGGASSVVVAADQRVSFTADRTTAQVSQVVLEGSITEQPVRDAGGELSRFTFRATVKNTSANEEVAGMPVYWSLQTGDPAKVTLQSSSDVTDENGVATLTVISKGAVVSDVRPAASTGVAVATPADRAVAFVANPLSGKVASVTLMQENSQTVTEKVANGSNSFTWQVSLTDADGNPLAGVTPAVTLTPEGAPVTVTVGKSDASGMAEVKVTSSSKAVKDIRLTVSHNGSSLDSAEPVSFTADSSSARVTNVSSTLTDLTQVPAGTRVPVVVTVKDAGGNLAQGIAVAVSATADSSAEVKIYRSESDDDAPSAADLTSNDNGEVTVYVTSTRMQAVTVTATVSAADNNNTLQVTFVADRATAAVRLLNWVHSVEGSGSVSDSQPVTLSQSLTADVDTLSLKASVTDTYGNPVAAYPVAFTATRGVFSPDSDWQTGTDGKVTAVLSGKSAGSTTVSVKAKNNAQDAGQQIKATFIANAATARVVSLGLANNTVTRVTAVVNNAVTLQVQVADANNNPVSSAVNLTLDDEAVARFSNDLREMTVAADSFTEAGKATLSLNSSAAGESTVTAATETVPSVTRSIVVEYLSDVETAKVTSVTQSAGPLTGHRGESTGSLLSAVIKDADGGPLSLAVLGDDFTVTWSIPADSKAFLVSDASAVSNTDEAKARKTLAVKGKEGWPVTLRSEKADESVVVTATVINNKGDKSTVKTTVTFSANPNFPVISGLTLTPPDGVSVPVAGIDRVKVSGVLKDKYDNPLKKTALSVSANNSAVVGTGVVTNDRGEFTTTLDSTKAGLITVTASSGAEVKTAGITFTGNKATAQVALSPVGNEVAAGGPGVTMTVTVKDANENPLDMAVTLEANNGGTLSLSSVETSGGSATVQLSSQNIAQVTVKATLTADNSKTASQTVTFVASDSMAHVSLLRADATTVTAGQRVGLTVTTSKGGVAQGNVSVSLSNAGVAGNVKFYADSTGTTELSGRTVTTGADGTAKVWVSAQVAGTETLTASSGLPAQDTSNTVTLTVNADSTRPSSDATQTVLSVDKSSAVADGVDAIAVTVTVRDIYGNLLKQLPVTLSSTLGTLTGGSNSGSSLSLTTDDNGKATATLKSTSDGDATLTLSGVRTGQTVVLATKKVVFAQARVTSLTLNGTAAEVQSTAGAEVTLAATVQANNAQKPLLDGVLVTFTVTNAEGTVVTPKPTATSNSSGVASVKLTPQKKGKYTITATTTSDSTGKTQVLDVRASDANGKMSLAESQAVTAGAYTRLVVTTADNNDNTVGKAVTFSAPADSTAAFYTKAEDDTYTLLSSNQLQTGIASGSAGHGSASDTGQAEVYVRVTKAGSVTVTAKAGTDNNIQASAVLTVGAADAVAPASVLLSGNITEKTANGTDTFEYKATLKDEFGNRVSTAGKTVTWKASWQNGSETQILASPDIDTDPTGISTFGLTSLVKAKDITVTATFGTTENKTLTAKNSQGNEVKVTFLANATNARVRALATTATSPVVGTRVPVTVSVRDGAAAGSNPVAAQVTVGVKSGTAAQVVFYKAASGDPVLPDNQVTTDEETGDATFYVWSSKAETLTLEGYTSQNPAIKPTLAIDWQADEASARVTGMKTESVPADGKVVGEGVKVTLNTVDQYGNPLAATVTLSEKDSLEKVSFYSDAALSNKITTLITAKPTGSTVYQGEFYVTSTKAQTITVQGKAGKNKETGTDYQAAITFISIAPVQSKSGIETSKTAYTAGEEMTVKVTLKDAQDKLVPGQSTALDKTGVVTVANATPASDSSWDESSTGVYTRSYTAQTSGTALKAAVTLKDWTAAAESKPYDIEADAASAIIAATVLDNGKKLTPADGKAGYKILITVKDKYDNALKSYSLKLTSPVLTTSKNVSTLEDGTVTAEISSSIAGSNDVTISSTTNTSVTASVSLRFSRATLKINSPSL
ncbi:MAG: Intimin [Candidatus Erwinia impunctatus]|nr:Intimin [Culicoides impunctatus]